VTEPAGTGLRYRLLETIRLFAAERLAETDQEPAAVGEAHCAHFLAVAEGAAPHLIGSEQGIWLDRLEADHANLRRAAEHAASQPDGTSRVLRFGIALRRYWGWRYRCEEAAALLVPVLGRPEAAADPALFAEALHSAVCVTFDIDLTVSMQLAEQMDQVAGRLGDDRLLIMCRATWAFLYSRVNDCERARPLAQDSVERARKLGDDRLLVAALVPYIFTVDPAAALPLYAEAIACSDRTGDLGDHYSLHNNAGWLALLLGDIPGARAHLEAAIRAAQAMRYPPPPRPPPSASCGEPNTTATVRAPHSNRPSGPAAASALSCLWPRLCSGLPAWPPTSANGTTQLPCTAPRKPCSTRPEIHGTRTGGVAATKASTR
jgi:hypothetical protein